MFQLQDWADWAGLITGVLIILLLIVSAVVILTSAAQAANDADDEWAAKAQADARRRRQNDELDLLIQAAIAHQQRDEYLRTQADWEAQL